MSVVIDASVLVSALVDSGTEGAWAAQLLADCSLTKGGLVAPSLVLVESTNILRRLELAGDLPQLEATMACRDVVRLPIQLVPFEPFSERIWQLRHNITSYDAWYVAIAEAFELPLATLDQKLTRSSGPKCEFQEPPR